MRLYELYIPSVQYIPWHDLSLLGLKVCMSKCWFWCWLYFFLLNNSDTHKYLFIINSNKEKTCRKKYSSFKNNIKPSREDTTFYCICIVHVYSNKNVFMVVHVYSYLLTGIIQLFWNFADVFSMEWSYECGFGIILWYFFSLSLQFSGTYLSFSSDSTVAGL